MEILINLLDIAAIAVVLVFLIEWYNSKKSLYYFFNMYDYSSKIGIISGILFVSIRAIYLIINHLNP